MDFLKGILSRLSGAKPVAAGSERPRVQLAAFGKHPGWDDHIDDVGVDTDALVGVKRMLYLQGISGNIDAGTWNELDAGHRLDQFDHLFIRQSNGRTLTGRLIASSDGKGRARYPMIVCADCGTMSVSDVVQNVCTPIETAAKKCSETRSRLEVISIIEQAQATLNLHLEDSPPRADKAASALAALANAPELSPDGSKLLLVLYQIHREMEQFRNGDANKSIDKAAAHLRVPACDTNPAVAVQQWLQLVSTKVMATTPILGIAAVQQGWVDIIVGDTRVQDLFCLQASRETIPFTTDIPYTLPEEFRLAASKDIDRYRAGNVQPHLAVSGT